MSDREDFGTGVRALSYDAVEATRRQETEIREANAGKDVSCTLCADTGLRPAPAPYGLIGCTWSCKCEAGQARRERGEI